MVTTSTDAPDNEAADIDGLIRVRGATVDLPPDKPFPVSAGILVGLGLGGLFDGIVLHQILQWHHMLSTWYPITTLENLQLNTFWDGVFHSCTYLLIIAGLFILWRTAQTCHLFWSADLLIGTLLMGFGTFNITEGIIDHQLLGVHHVNELVAKGYRIYWDVGFLVWGLSMLIAGRFYFRRGQSKFAIERRAMSRHPPR